MNKAKIPALNGARRAVVLVKPFASDSRQLASGAVLALIVALPGLVALHYLNSIGKTIDDSRVRMMTVVENNNQLVAERAELARAVKSQSNTIETQETTLERLNEQVDDLNGTVAVYETQQDQTEDSDKKKDRDQDNNQNGWRFWWN